jgi:hypothetical protein
MSAKTETEKVTLELPKPITKFIKDSWSTNNLPETLTKEVINLCVSQLEADANESGVFPEELMKKHGLLPVFKQYRVLPEYYREAEIEAKKDLESDLQLVTLKIELAKPFVDFIEQYRQYFGSSLTIELICMKMIYDQTKRLFNELDGFARQKDSFLDKSDFFKKYFYLGSVSWEEPEEENSDN